MDVYANFKVFLQILIYFGFVGRVFSSLKDVTSSVGLRAETKALIGGGGCIFIYSRSARRISFEISCHYR